MNIYLGLSDSKTKVHDEAAYSIAYIVYDYTNFEINNCCRQ